MIKKSQLTSLTSSLKKSVASLSCLTVVLSALSSFSSVAEEANTKSLDVVSFDAVYDLYRQGDLLGEGQRELKKLADNQYRLSLDSELEWLIFSDKRKEVSTFNMDKGQISPLSYKYERSGTGKDKSLSVSFLPDNKLSIDPRPKKNAAPEDRDPKWLDEMTMHMQIQLDLLNGKKEFNYTIISSRGEIREYVFEVIGEELISTGMGRFKAIKIARVYEDRKFYAQHAWFIPELNYTLARLWRMKKGVEQYDLVIKSYTSSLI